MDSCLSTKCFKFVSNWDLFGVYRNTLIIKLLQARHVWGPTVKLDSQSRCRGMLIVCNPIQFRFAATQTGPLNQPETNTINVSTRSYWDISNIIVGNDPYFNTSSPAASITPDLLLLRQHIRLILGAAASVFQSERGYYVLKEDMEQDMKGCMYSTCAMKQSSKPSANTVFYTLMAPCVLGCVGTGGRPVVCCVDVCFYGMCWGLVLTVGESPFSAFIKGAFSIVTTTA